VTQGITQCSVNTLTISVGERITHESDAPYFTDCDKSGSDLRQDSRLEPRGQDASTHSSEATLSSRPRTHRRKSPADTDPTTNVVEAEIVYALEIYRKRRNKSPGQLYVDDHITQSVPFDVHICADLPPKRKGSLREDSPQLPQSYQSPTVLEVVTHVVDQSYSTRDSRGHWSRRHPSRSTTNDLRLSRILRREIIIRSRYLKDILHEIIEYYPDHADLQSPSRVVIAEPFQVLMHHYQEIESWLSAHQEPTTETHTDSLVRTTQLAHMRVLKRFLQEQYDNTVRSTIELLSTSIPTINFEMIWYLFKPGTDVYMQTPGGVAVAVVQSIRSDAAEGDKPARRWHLQCWRMATNGARVARVTCSGIIVRYSGHREVIALPVCPVDIWDAQDNGSRRAKIRARNMIYFEALQKGSLHVQYDGLDFTDGRTVSINTTETGSF